MGIHIGFLVGIHERLFRIDVALPEGHFCCESLLQQSQGVLVIGFIQSRLDVFPLGKVGIPFFHVAFVGRRFFQVSLFVKGDLVGTGLFIGDALFLQGI